jgi:hypothetical protein
MLIAVVPSKCWVSIFATEPARTGLDGGDASEVREVAGVICGGRSDKDRGEEVRLDKSGRFELPLQSNLASIFHPDQMINSTAIKFKVLETRSPNGFSS